MKRLLRRIASAIFPSPDTPEAESGPSHREVDSKWSAPWTWWPLSLAHAAELGLSLDRSQQILRVSAGMESEYGTSKTASEPTLHSTPPLSEHDEFVSAAVLAQKAKQFDDGLYAAVDLAAQRGAGILVGKSAMLRALCAALARVDSEAAELVLGIVCGAARLGGLELNLPARAEASVERCIADFLSSSKSKPIGFYTRSQELEAIFRQDRLLQSELKGPAGILALIEALRSDHRARQAYEAHIALTSRLTNPPAYPDLRPFIAASTAESRSWALEEVYLVSPSVSHETELAKRLYGDRSIPSDWNVIDELVRRISSGELSLVPSEASGWYDHQTWALEPLVAPGRMPEAVHLELDESYRQLLVELFRGILALTRETHVKALEQPLLGASLASRAIRFVPELSAEPVPTYYLRRALGYKFVRTVLEDAFGAEALSQLHRLSARGPEPVGLRQELIQMEALFNGAAVTVGRELGFAPDAPEICAPNADADANAAAFVAWVGNLGNDPDLGMDTRMMVPVFYDVEREMTKVWVFLGWAERPLQISFARPPLIRSTSGDAPNFTLSSRHVNMTYPVSAEVYVTRLLDRDEFRRHCDRYVSASAILEHLE